LEQERDPNVTNSKKETPLHFAMFYGRPHAIAPLLRKGAKVHKNTIDSWTPLIMGTMKNQKESLKELIQASKAEGIDIDINLQNRYGETALHFAASHGLLEIIELLIGFGANIQATTLEGHTPLDLAMKNNQQQTKEYLILMGAKKGTIKLSQMPPRGNIPCFIDFGCIPEKKMREIEQQFGGAPWCDTLEVFYTGKRPKVGYCIELALVLINPNFPLDVCTWMLGIISSVSKDRKKIMATVRLNSNHTEYFSQLNGEWEAILEWCPHLENSWCLTNLIPLKEECRSLSELRIRRHKMEQLFGRKVSRISIENRAIVLKGSHVEDFRNVRFLVRANLSLEDFSLKLYFEDGGEEELNCANYNISLFRKLLEQNLALKSKGVKGAILNMDGVEAWL